MKKHSGVPGGGARSPRPGIPPRTAVAKPSSGRVMPKLRAVSELRVLLLEQDSRVVSALRRQVRHLTGASGVSFQPVAKLSAALAHLAGHKFDTIVIALNFSDGDVLDAMRDLQTRLTDHRVDPGTGRTSTGGGARCGRGRLYRVGTRGRRAAAQDAALCHRTQTHLAASGVSRSVRQADWACQSRAVSRLRAAGSASRRPFDALGGGALA